ncbi:hypothetical protein ATE69_05875 [Sphingopyxis sp. H071]|nr:hypothetical protein ATE61_09960 [Sphingopyxis sp. H057]KTE53798.1 hypothetical protein ATE64_05890 [Sphingopyxis sp. H073]KTE56393.1 hypothetical protein ATE69_05875 [Sphingopyxis sp. H071]KTE63121.1 hypothetical protein ATE66_00650 [Sphingopyxis sp. H107]KTE67351.1 hypothetical protein ATE65_02735 [Sphingopyxis sp. H100]KTE71194.1 hypothetical protein ATE60_14010 [Sphingopyxis sp. H081]KTE81845.1 hypothetical protein ATE63_05260 [Sphingopyxis sp. H067]MBD3733592.1 hypothetical protein [
MQKSMILTSAMALVLLTGCEKAEAPAPTDTPTTTEEVPVETVPAEGAEATDPATAPHRFADWAGKWTGVEGMYATITPTEPGKYKLEMQSDLDTKGTYDGEDSEHGIKFKRGSEELSLRRGSGDETGLKYLAGKKECLIVKEGEGYCRD